MVYIIMIQWCFIGLYNGTMECISDDLYGVLIVVYFMLVVLCYW